MTHTFAMFLHFTISPTFWHDLLEQTAFRTVAVAGSVTAIIKGIRKVYPDLSGPWALLANLVFSIAGVLAGMTPANIFSETTVVQLGLVIAAAGGFHNIWNTIRELLPKNPKDADKTPAFPAIPGGLTPVLLLVAVLGLAGCNVSASTPTTAPSIYQNGAQAMDNFATDLQQAQGIEKSLVAVGAIDKATDARIEKVFSDVAGYGIQIDSLLLAQASAVTLTATINAAITSLTSIATIAANLDPATLAQVVASTNALKTLLTNLLPVFVSSVSLVTPNPIIMEVAFGPRSVRNISRKWRSTRLGDLQSGEGRATREIWLNHFDAHRNAVSRC